MAKFTWPVSECDDPYRHDMLSKTGHVSWPVLLIEIVGKISSEGSKCENRMLPK